MEEWGLRNRVTFKAVPIPETMQNNGLYGYYYGFRAIMLHTFGVQVHSKRGYVRHL